MGVGRLFQRGVDSVRVMVGMVMTGGGSGTGGRQASPVPFSAGGVLGEDFSEGEELGGGVAGFVEGGVVVVAGDVGEEAVVVPVGSGHEAEAGAAVEHVEVDSGAAVEDVVEVFELGFEVAGLVGVAPVVEPAGPVLGDEERLAGLEGLRVCPCRPGGCRCRS